jgi:hypothetical protein
MKKSFLFLIFLLLNNSLFSQQPGEAYYPETAYGAQYINPEGHRLKWRNPDSTIYNVVYFSADSQLVAESDPSVIIIDGSPATVFDTVNLSSVEPLQWITKYYWKVTEYYNGGNINGPVWMFTSTHNPACDYFDSLYDNFESGLNLWEVETVSGCPWSLFDIISRGYQMPPQATGMAAAADADYCGSGGNGSTSNLIMSVSVNKIYALTIEWDNDWYAVNPSDEAYVDYSTDGGINWINIWSRVGVSERNTHEYAIITSIFYPPQPILIKFRAVQPGWDGWWAIDNVHIRNDCPLTEYFPPKNLRLNTILTPVNKVELNWEKWGFPFSEGFLIQRKNGLPSDTGIYYTLGQVANNITTYTDTTVEENKIYSYRVYNIPYSFEDPCNEATAYIAEGYVPVELTSFAADINGNNVQLNWKTASEINNRGFEVERKIIGRRDNSRSNSHWEKIGYVAGFGTTIEPRSYIFTDNRVIPGKYWYRLRQIDYDGSYEYSNQIEVEVTAPYKFSLEQNYPNPFNPVTTIKYSIGKTQFVTLKVYDVLGNETAILVNEEKPSGTYEVIFDGKNLSSGIYFYRLSAGSFNLIRKMTLMK